MYNRKSARLPRLQALALAIQAAWTLPVWALPEGATVVNGQVSIANPAAGTLQIQASNGAIINWSKFSISAGELTKFVQPGATAAVLNRVTGADMSQLLGTLQANGQVFLINPNGIVIGSAARIDTNSFIASTLDIADADFLAGKLKFAGNATSGNIRNEGLITAGPGGSIALIAPNIENSGIIRTEDGNILLAAGRSLEIASMDLAGVRFEVQAPSDSVLNLGQILANNGAVRAFAGSLRNSGTIVATRMDVNAAGEIVLSGTNDVTLTSDSVVRADGAHGGAVTIESKLGTVQVAGTVSATGSAGTGGDIRLVGDRVAVNAGTTVDASGSSGGGQILVGGDLQGGNAAVQNAQRTYVDANATLKADATDSGNGGRVVVWADENTRYYGTISAQGGPNGGNGGTVEVSGKVNLDYAGTVKLGAPQGMGGTLLLDPLDIIVANTGGLLPSVVDQFADFSGNVASISPAQLAAVGSTVTLQANRNILVNNAINLTAAGAGLNMTAGGTNFTGGSITMNADVTTVGGAVTVRATSINGTAGISSGGGAIDVRTYSDMNWGGPLVSSGGAVSLSSQIGQVVFGNVTAGSGTINVSGTQIQYGSYTTSGVANFTTNGQIYLPGSSYRINGGTINLSAGNSIYAYVSATDRVNANSTGSYIDLINAGTTPLNLGTITSTSDLYLDSSVGFAQAAGGVLTAPRINLYNGNNTVASAGTLAAPLQINANNTATQVQLISNSMGAPLYANFNSSATVGKLMLDGTTAALGGSRITGSNNLNISLAAGTGVVNVSALSTSGLSSGLSLSVGDGGISATSIATPNANVTLNASGGITVGTMSGGSLYASSNGAVVLGTVDTTNSNGVQVYNSPCNSFSVCSVSAPITVGTINSSGGSITLSNYANGDITAGTLSALNSITLNQGVIYRSGGNSGYPNFVNYTLPTTGNIIVGSAQSGSGFNANITGNGNVNVSSLTSANYVQVYVGNNYNVSSASYPYYASQTTTNNVSINFVEPVAGASNGVNIYNSGIGNIAVTGDMSRSGQVVLQASNGNVSDTGNITAGSYIDLRSSGSMTLGNVNSTAYYLNLTAGGPLTTGNLAAYYGVDARSGGAVVTGNIDTVYGGAVVDAGGTLQTGNITTNVLFGTGGDVQLTGADNVSFGTIQSQKGSVAITSNNGSIQTTLDGTGIDITAFADVTLLANGTGGFIGNPAFTNPFSVKAGASNTVTLSATGNIGTSAIPTTIDTNGTINISSYSGQFHATATNGTGLNAVANVSILGSAPGIGVSGSSSLQTANYTASLYSNDGSNLGLGQINTSAGTLDNFKVTALNNAGGLYIDNTTLNTSGTNNFTAISDGWIDMYPDWSMNIRAGNISLTSRNDYVSTSNLTAVGGGAVVNLSGAAGVYAGNISATSIFINSGADVSTSSLTATGTNRYNYQRTPDQIQVGAVGDITIYGAVNGAATVDINSASGNVTLDSSVTASGTERQPGFWNYAPDYLKVRAGGGSIDINGSAMGATSVELTAANNVNVTGIISGGSTYFGYPYSADTMSVNANLTGGGISAYDINGGYYTNIAASGISAGSITGNTNTLNVHGTDIAFTNLSGSGTVNITADAGFAPDPVSGNINIGANTLKIVSVNDLDISKTYTPPINIALIVNNVNVSATNVNLTSSTGNVVARLHGTTNLNVDTAKGFVILNDTLMSNTTIYADWEKATNSNGNTGSLGAALVTSALSGQQLLNYSMVGSNLNVSMGTTVSNNWNLTVRDRSATATNLNFSAATPGSGNYTLDFSNNASTINASGIAMGTTRLNLYTDGAVNVSGMTAGGLTINAGDAISVSALTASNYLDIYASTGNVTLANVNVTPATSSYVQSSNGNVSVNGFNTTGGSLYAYSYNGSANVSDVTTRGGLLHVEASNDVNLENISTASTTSWGGDLYAESYNGNINHLNNTAAINLSGPSGMGQVTLWATNGNIGSAVAPVTLSNNRTLMVGAANEIRIQDNTSALNSLYIDATANGTGLISIAGIANLSGLSITRVDSGANLALAGVNPNAAMDFSLYSGNGGIKVTDNISGVGNLTLYAYSGDVTLAADAGVHNIAAGGQITLNASRDLLLSGGNGTGSALNISALGNTYLTAGRDIIVAGGSGAAASVAVRGNSYLYGNASRNLQVLGGSGAGASASLGNTGYYMDLTASSGNVDILGGSGLGATATVAMTQAGYTQTVYAGGNITVQGGSGDNASAAINSSGYQNLTAAGNFTVQGGNATLQGSAASAQVVATNNQSIGVDDIFTAAGGSGVNTSALVSAGGSQTIGFYENGYSTRNTNDILIAGGSATGASVSVLAGSTQRLFAGRENVSATNGNISILGGSGDGAFALVNTSGSQTLGSQAFGSYTVCCYATFTDFATQNITIAGGTGADAYASVGATSSQQINFGGNLAVTGGNGNGAYAELRSTGGSQSIGSAASSGYNPNFSAFLSNDQSGAITVSGGNGTGSSAFIGAQGSQTIQLGGALAISGGVGINSSAGIESLAGFQTIGNNSTSGSDPTDSISVRGGTGAGALATIRAASGQDMRTGGAITVAGGSATGAAGEIRSTAGSQSIGTLNSFSVDGTDSITITGGSTASAWGRIVNASGSQSIVSIGAITLTGGNGTDADARIEAATGQNLTSSAGLMITGGVAPAANGNQSGVRNTTSGTQLLNLGTSGLSVLGGGAGSSTFVSNNGAGNQSVSTTGSVTVTGGTDGSTVIQSSGTQSIVTSGSVVITAPQANPNGTAGIIATGNQSVQANSGTISVNNAGGLAALISAGGTQSISTRSIDIALGADPVTNAKALIRSTGDQTINLLGVHNTANSATLSISNLSSATGSVAGVQTTGNLVINSDYTNAGAITIGTAAGQGATQINASGNVTIVSGSLTLQGGATAASRADLIAGPTKDMLISTIYGPVTVKGGDNGNANIDPALLAIVSNGEVALIAGLNSSATITATNFDLAAALGNLILDTTNGGSANITSSVFNFTGSADLTLNTGTITATSGTISIPGFCVNCDLYLLGSFSGNYNIPPQYIPTVVNAPITSSIVTLTDVINNVTYGYQVNPDGTLTLTTKKLNQCY